MDGTFIPKDVPNDISLAIEAVTKVFENALASGKHQPGGWRKLGLDGNLEHFREHETTILNPIYYNEAPILKALSEEDDLVNLCCRALMLLQLCEEARRDALSNSKV